MLKLNRNYLFGIEPPVKSGAALALAFDPNVDQREIIKVERPFTIEFDITQNTNAATRQATFKLYNLSRDVRDRIRKDEIQYDVYRKVFFDGGYGTVLSNCFSGNIFRAWSFREGVNYITQVDAYGWGYAANNAKSEIPYRKGTPVQSLVQLLVNDLKPYGIFPGLVGTFSGTMERGGAISGSTAENLNLITNGAFFVFNGRSYCLNLLEAYEGDIPVISKATGLLGTPIREQFVIHADMLFEPRLMVGQRILLESETGEGVNQYWKVLSVKHRGMISETVCGSATTSVGLYAGDFSLVRPA